MRRRNTEDNYLFYDFVWITAALPGLVWLRPKVVYSGLEARRALRGGVLVVANHSGYLDPAYLMMAIWYRRHHFICLDSFFDGPFRRWLFTRFHCIPIDRENFSLESLRRISDALRAGKLVTMFPEGHIAGRTGVHPFKAGMVLMARQSGRPIVPVYIRPRAHWYSRLKVAVGEPVDVGAALGERPSLAQIEQAAAELERRERALMSLVK